MIFLNVILFVGKDFFLLTAVAEQHTPVL